MNKEFNSFRYSSDVEINDVEKIRINKVLRLIGRNKSILDLACWDGSISEIIKKNNNKVLGIEISDNAIKKARAKGIEVFDIDLNSNWSNNVAEKFDVVFAGEIIEHIFDTDNFLKQVWQVLKPSGFLVITTPNVASLGRRLLLLLGRSPLIEVTARNYDAGHIRYFTFSSLLKLLLENNFNIDQAMSDSINFNKNGNIKTSFFANIFPSLGRTLIVKASIKNE